jgi:hypothetical protein
MPESGDTRRNQSLWSRRMGPFLFDSHHLILNAKGADVFAEGAEKSGYSASSAKTILWGGGNITNVIKNFSNTHDHGWLAGKIIDY